MTIEVWVAVVVALASAHVVGVGVGWHLRDRQLAAEALAAADAAQDYTLSQYATGDLAGVGRRDLVSDDRYTEPE